MATFAEKYRRSDGNGGGTSFASQYRKDASGKAPLGAARDEYMKLVKKQETITEKLAAAQQNIDKYTQQANRWGQAVSVLEGITRSVVRPAISLYSGITQPMRSAFNMSPAASSYNVPVLGPTETYQGQAGRVVSDIRSTGGSLGRASVATAGIAAQPAIDVLSTVYTPTKVALGFKGGGIVGAGLQGAKIGAPVTGAQSLADSAIEGKNLKQAAIDAAKATLTGGAAGFTLGAAGGVLGVGASAFARFYRKGSQEATEQVAKKTEVKPPVKTVDKKAETTAPKEETVSFYHRGENKATLHGGDWVDGDLKTHEGRAPADNITHIEIPKSQVSKYIREVSPEHSKEKVFRIKDGEMIPPEYIKRNDFLKKQGVSFDKPNTKASQASDDPLIQEARKYKSAEEFVNSQTDLHHGSPASTRAEIEKNGLSLQDRRDTMNKGSGISFSVDRNHATKFAGEKGGVTSVALSKDAKLVSGDEFNSKMREIYSGTSLRGEELAKTKAAEYFKGNGYDGIDYRTGKASESVEKEVRIWNLDKVKTKSQLTDLWKKANDDDAAKTTPKAEKIPEQQKPSGFAEKIKKDAIEKGLAKEFPDSATYTPKTLKEEAAKTKEIFDSGIDRVVKILEGKEELPSNIRPESFSVAAKIFAKNTGEEATRVRNALIAGKYSKIASEAGQGLSLLRDGESTTDPVRIINRIRKAREEAATKRTKSKGTNEAKKNVKTDIKKVLDRAKKVPTKETWAQFVKDIEC